MHPVYCGSEVRICGVSSNDLHNLRFPFEASVTQTLSGPEAAPKTVQPRVVEAVPCTVGGRAGVHNCVSSPSRI